MPRNPIKHIDALKVPEEKKKLLKLALFAPTEREIGKLFLDPETRRIATKLANMLDILKPYIEEVDKIIQK